MRAFVIPTAVLLLFLGSIRPLAAGGPGDALGPDLVVNGDFDTGLGGWIEEDHSNFTSNWVNWDDAGDSVQSGALQGEGKNGDPPPSHHIVWQCLPVTPGAMYRLGASLRQSPLDERYTQHGEVVVYPATATGCAEAGAPLAQIRPPERDTWQRRYTTFTVPSGVTRVQVAARADQGFTHPDARPFPNESNFVLYDQIELRQRLTDVAVAFVAPTPNQAVSNQAIEVRVEIHNNSPDTNAKEPSLILSHFNNLQLLGHDCAGSVTAIGGGRLRWEGVDTILPGLYIGCTLQMRVVPSFVGDLLLQAEATTIGEGNPADNQASHTIDVAGAPDITTSISVGPELPSAGDLVVATLQLQNVGTQFALPTVTLGTDGAVVLEDAGTCPIFTQTNSQLIEGLTFLGTGETVQCQLSLRIPAATPERTLTFTLDANASGDSVPENDVSQASLAVVRLRVDTTADGFDRNPGDGRCEQTQGGSECSLRAAIMEANALPGRRTIELPYNPSPYLLDRTVGDDSVLKGDLDIRRSMILRGIPSGTGALPVVQGAFPAGSPSRLVSVDTNSSALTVIENVVLSGQDLAPPANDRGGHGGIVHHDSGELRLRNVVLRHGNAGAGSGGGLYSADTVHLERVRVHDNRATFGGGVALDFAQFALPSIRDSWLHDNQGGTESAGGGGGIGLKTPGALVGIFNTTLNGNVARVGGALALDDALGVLLGNSTLSGNDASLVGGAIWMDAESALDINHSTIAYNAVTRGDDATGVGGGVFVTAGGAASLYGSILAFNEARRTGTPPLTFPLSGNCFGTIASAGYNSLSSVTSDAECDITAGTGDAFNVVPDLAALADNGGFAPTHALLSPRNEVDKAEAVCRGGLGNQPLGADQRGALRPVDGDADGIAACDKGAFEISEGARIAVTKSGAGNGLVTSQPGGIHCGATCEGVFILDTPVVLTAAAQSGSVFLGWSGACEGLGPCELLASGVQQVDALFEPAAATRLLSVNVDAGASTGTGRVISVPAGIDCPGSCSAAFANGSTVQLIAIDGADSVFLGFVGAGCSGSEPECSVEMNVDREVLAVFDLATSTLTVQVSGSGTGRVTSSPTGIDCPGDCVQTYPVTTSVALTATPMAGSLFTGWTGACSSTGTCQLDMDLGPHAAGATFQREGALFSDGFE